jgi:hypothetical protein
MSDDPSGKKPPKLRLSYAQGQVEGRYVNLAICLHNPTEFVLDFAFAAPGVREARVVSRVVMNPINAKRFAQALNENVRRFEERFGEIDTKRAGPEPTLH